MDGSHIDVDRHLPLRCHLINLGGCAITYGKDFGCRLFSEPALAVEDDDLYLRSPDGARGETLIAGPLLGALRTVREVERLADAVESLSDDRHSPCWTAPWPSGTCSGASIPATSPICSSEGASETFGISLPWRVGAFVVRFLATWRSWRWLRRQRQVSPTDQVLPAPAGASRVRTGCCLRRSRRWNSSA